MQLILGHDREVAAWSRRLMPAHIDFAKDLAAIGVAENGVLIAAAVFTDYHKMPLGSDIQIGFAAASPRWAQRGIIRGILAYPFRQLSCNRLTTIVSRNNKRARRLIEGLGFQLEGVHWRAYDGKSDAISYGLRNYVAEEKWLGRVPMRAPEVMRADTETTSARVQ